MVVSGDTPAGIDKIALTDRAYLTVTFIASSTITRVYITFTGASFDTRCISRPPTAATPYPPPPAKLAGC